MLDIEGNKWAAGALKNLEFFSDASEEDILTLVERFERGHFKSESTILFSGEISNRFYLVRSGSVAVWKTADGERKKVAQLGEGKYFGEISLLTPSSATATVKAESDVELLILSSEDFEFSFRNRPEKLQLIKKKIEEKRSAPQAG